MKTFITVLLITLLAAPFKSPSATTTAQTRDNWRSVRTNNLFVIGNADPEKLRQVAAWLEFFHSAFARLVSRSVLDQSVPTTVVLFRDEASFTPFKPLYQGRPANVAGFFQPGEDVNYIAISLDPGERDPFSTAFHEYVHLHLKDNVPNTPLWLNEGLAEFYGTMQFSGGEAVLGAPLAHYVRLLREQEMLPLATLFSIGTNSPRYNEQEKSGVFYGQSWALVHYLMLGGGGRQDQFKRFLQLVSRGDAPAKALADTYGTNLETIEQDLRAYVRRGEFPSMRIASADPEAYASYTAMQRSSLTDAEANYYLGDLLFHINRQTDAERYFKQAIALDPNLLQAQAALGLLYVYQRRYAEAKRYFQRATQSQQSYLIHYLYAFILSREGVSATGAITSYSKESAATMRDNLLKSIKLAPQYAPAYYLLSLVDFVMDERLDEALEMVQRARQLAPTKSSYSLLLAQIYLRRSQNAEARELLESLARSSDTEVRSDAKEILDSLSSSGGQPNRSTATTPRVSSAMITEPAATGSSPRIVGGGNSESVEIRDGNKITNPASLPTVDEVLKRHVEAMGGVAAINRVTSRVITGTVDVAGISRGGSFETYALAPDKLLTVIQAHPIGTIKIGFNGKNGWYMSTGAVRAMKGAELATLQREADFYSPLRIKNNFAKVTMPGMSKIGYRDVYVLDLQPLSGPPERLYLDAQTYLPVRINTARTVGRITEPVEIYLDDWRDFDGVKYPFATSQNSPSVKLGFTVKEIRHNVAVDTKIFQPTR
ncbi:MAG TPA: tetratricopeptide repeat protein [Pyrinomonadaceae bacterium]|nr:tetratricopeptide repeat protein [Pyrinomonadaceae bacterium]